MKCPLCNDLNLEISALVSHLSAQTLQTLDFGFVKRPSRLCVLQWAEASKVVGAEGGIRTRGVSMYRFLRPMRLTQLRHYRMIRCCIEYFVHNVHCIVLSRMEYRENLFHGAFYCRSIAFAVEQST